MGDHCLEIAARHAIFSKRRETCIHLTEGSVNDNGLLRDGMAAFAIDVPTDEPPPLYRHLQRLMQSLGDLFHLFLRQLREHGQADDLAGGVFGMREVALFVAQMRQGGL